MARRPSTFKKADVTKMVAAVVTAGVEVREVLVDIDGRIRVVAGKPASEKHVSHNEWDDVYEPTPTQVRHPVS